MHKIWRRKKTNDVATVWEAWLPCQEMEEATLAEVPTRAATQMQSKHTAVKTAAYQKMAFLTTHD